LTLARNNPDDPCVDQKAGSGKSWTSAESDGVHAKEAGRSNWQRGVKTYHYMHLNWFFLLFSCQFAVSFFWPLSFICADCTAHTVQMVEVLYWFPPTIVILIIYKSYTRYCTSWTHSWDIILGTTYYYTNFHANAPADTVHTSHMVKIWYWLSRC
jgi:hypothetical protein